jgi:hypothetical protein
MLILKSFHKKIIIIQSLNTRFNDLNLLALHILCLNETKIQNIQTHQEIYNII